MKISKIQIKNLLGLKEVELDGKSIELTGGNGTGKTSVIDAVRYALTNKSERDYIVRKGSTEGEILIETDNGLSINRKPRTNKTDYKSIKQLGHEVQKPESFLSEIFTPLQLSPVEFLSWSKEEQNRAILNLVEYPWNMETIRSWFNEIPPWVDYEKSILEVLHQIQSEEGQYYLDRWEINRLIRDKSANIVEIGENIPPQYNVNHWEEASLSEIYTKIESLRKQNEEIESAKNIIDNLSSKIRHFEADREIKLAELEKDTARETQNLNTEVAELQEKIKAIQYKLDTIEERKQSAKDLIQKDFESQSAQYTAVAQQHEELSHKEIQDLTDLIEEARQTEQMKSYINEYKRMERLEQERKELKIKSESLTEKIELARKLPGEILEKAVIPVQGLTVENGLALIDGLPFSNRSEGEKLDLCIDIAVSKPNALQIILIDGVEKLSSTNREKLYSKCREKGLQFIATRTTDDNELLITEL